jgi:hypothetical protein
MKNWRLESRPHRQVGKPALRRNRILKARPGDWRFFIGQAAAIGHPTPAPENGFGKRENVVWRSCSVIHRILIQAKCGQRLAGWFLTVAGLLALAGISRGQEALRLSVAGDVAAATEQQNNTSLGYYNLLLGPTSWRFSSGLDLEYNSNVRLASNSGGSTNSSEGDIIIRPSVNVNMHWPVTLQNSLDVSIAGGYSEYLLNPDLSQFFINPGSGLSFDIYSGDFRINLHDQISISEEAYQNPGVSGENQNLVSLQNTAGIRTTWDLNKAIANVGFDHVNYVSLSQNSQNQGEPDGASENIFINGGIRVRPELLLGLEAGGSVITYSASSATNTLTTPNAVQWSVGTFGSAKISQYIDVRADVGYTVYTPGNTATNLVTSETSGYYCSLSLSHRVNQFLTYTLTAGRSTDLAAYGQPQSYYFARFDPIWNLFQKYTLSTPLWWQQGTSVYGTTAGGTSNYQQIGLGLTVSHAITKKLSGSISYRFVQETSDQSALDYTDHIVDLNFSYQF